MDERERERRRRFDALFASYSSDIVAYCGWRAGSASDAQDAVAEVFLTAWRRLDELPEGDASRVWLYATARRVIANQRRSSRRRAALQERLTLEAAAGPQEALPDRQETLVHEALRRLGPRDREVLLLAEWEGLSPAQIATVLGSPAVTARGRLHRARRRFRAVFEELRDREDRPTEISLRRPVSALRPRRTQLPRRVMNTSEGFEALRRVNPRSHPGFAQSVEAAGEKVRAQVVYEPTAPTRRRRLRVSAAGVSVAVVAAAAGLVTVGSPGGDTATAAVERAGSVTAASAEQSGTAVVRVTQDGELWAGSMIRWNVADVAVVRDVSATSFRKVGDAFRVVDGTFYGLDPRGGWIAQGDPRNIDPDSGTTPAEYLAAVREDIGGVTVTRITRALSGSTRGHLPDGSTVYRGTVASGLVAREVGFKEGQAIRVLPFGYVAHDEAADAAAPLDAVVTVGADGVVREISLSWGTWRYTVAYSHLGSTAAPVAPANARDLLKERGLRD